MAFTVRSPFYEEDERRRREAAALAGASNAAARGIMGGLEAADSEQKYQAELRFKKAGDDRDAKRLVLQESAGARADAADSRAAEEHAATLRFRESEAARKAREAAKAALAEKLQAQVAASIARGGEPIEDEPTVGSIAGMEVPIEPVGDNKSAAQRLASRLRDTQDFNELTEAEIVAEYERQANERMNAGEARADRERKAALEERDLIRREKDSAAQRARDYAAAESAKDKANETKVDPTSARKAAGYDASLAGLRALRDRKKQGGVNIGPVDSRVNSIAQAFSLDDSEVTRFKADIANEINTMIAELSGANVPEGEMARLRAGLPSPNDQDGAFMQKLDSTIAHLERARSYLGVPPSTAAPAGGRATADSYFGGG